MIPDQFREFDRVARGSFRFLVQERGCAHPTVEYWRDYYLAYELPSDIKISVGTERGISGAGWLGVFINIAYKDEGHVLFFLDSVLEELGVSTRAGKLSWPSSIKEYSAVFEEHFDSIVDYVRAQGVERAKQGPDSKSQDSSLVLRGADGSVMKSVCIGAGVHFWGSQFLPIDLETFWGIVDKGYSPTYAAFRCPSCRYRGNVGQRLRKTGTFAFVRTIKLISLLIVVLSVVGCAVIGGWRQSDFRVPVTAAAFLAWVLSRIAEAKLAGSGFLALCPHCGCESNEFTLEGPPPTVADGVNPLRPRSWF